MLSQRMLFGILAATAAWKLIKLLLQYGQSRPYSTARVGVLLSLHRLLVDYTRKGHSFDWFPGNSVTETNPTRLQENGHSIAGAVRDAARRAISDAVMASGRTKFEFNPSTHSKDVTGSAHPHLAPSDLDLPYSAGVPGPSEVVVGIDTDYYVECWDDYLGRGNPAIFHTFAPTDVCGVDGDCAFRIVDNEVVYDVSGGARWQHRIWDWCAFGEYLYFDAPSDLDGFLHSFLYILGFRRRMFQKVHHLRPWVNCPHRALVYTIPQFSCWIHSLLPCEMHARKLERVCYTDPSRPTWNHLVSTAETGATRISVGRAGEDACFNIPKANFDMLMGLSAQAAVTARCYALGFKDQNEIGLIGEYYNKTLISAIVPTRMAKPAKVIVHRPPGSSADVEKVTFRAYADPLVTDCNQVPNVKLWECMEASINARITTQTNEVTPPRGVAILATEFVRLVVPVPHIGVPLSLEATAARLNKPSQVLAVKRVWETMDVEHRRLIEGFPKREPTNKPPRIISSFPDPRFLLGLSRYTLAFRDLVLESIENKAWFCPGLTPTAIAEKVCEYVGLVQDPSEGDYSNFDGTVSAWCQRHVMNAVYYRFFNTLFHDELSKYTSMLISCPARSKHFFNRYDAGVGVRSGSPTTCDLNTVLNCFIMYAAVRTTCTELTPEEAYLQVGLAFGDDSLFCARYKRAWNKVATSLGMKLKVADFNPEHGITFLARVFPKPHSSTTSMQDPLRTWRKLHLTARALTVPLASAACDRVQGYLVTDGLSPVTGAYCRMIERHYAPETDGDGKRDLRACRHQEKPFWLTEGGTWPQDEADVTDMLHCAAARTGFTPEQLQDVETVLDDAGPWSGVTLNRDELPMPYVGTFDNSAMPLHEVDARIPSNDVNQATSEGNSPGPSASEPSGLPPGGSPGQQPSPSQPNRHQGPRGPPGVSAKGREDPGEQRQGAAGETDGPGIPGASVRGGPGGARTRGAANRGGGGGRGGPRGGQRGGRGGRGAGLRTGDRLPRGGGRGGNTPVQP